MKKINIGFAFVLLLFAIVSCSKDDQELQKSNTDNDITLRHSSNLNVLDGMLQFSSKTELADYYTSVETLKENWDSNPNSRDSKGEYIFFEDYLMDVYQQIGVTNLASHYSDLSHADIQILRDDRSYIGLPLLQNLLSEKKEIAVGQNIVKYVELNKIAIIENLSLEGLEDVRANGVHSDHALVSYVDRYTDEAYKIPVGGPGGPSTVGCSSYLSVVHETFYGDLANKVKIDGKLKRLDGLCDYSIDYTIDWGDGNVTNGLSGTHTYETPGFTDGDCYNFTITITAEWTAKCDHCPKGRTLVKTIDVKLCPLDDLCVYGRYARYESEIFYTNPGSAKYKLDCEIGIEKCGSIFDYYIVAYATSKFYKTVGHPNQNNWVPTTPDKNLGVDLYGTIYSDETCDLNYPIPSSPRENKVVEISKRNHRNISNAYIHKTGPDKLFGDFWVEMNNTTKEITGLTLSY